MVKILAGSLVIEDSGNGFWLWGQSATQVFWDSVLVIDVGEAILAHCMDEEPSWGTEQEMANVYGFEIV